MNLGIRSMVVLAGLIAAHGMLAQAPAGAPAGSNGICKDGSYSTAASKEGACRGHKGVQTWYGATTAKAAKSPAGSASPKSAAPGQAAAAPVAATPAASAPAAKPSAQTPAPMASAAPAQSTPPMTKTASSKAPSSRSQLAQMPPAPGGGNGLVWVNTASKVYHCQGTDFYGKTKAGAYMSEADAKAKGARPDAGKPCTK